MSGIHKIGLLGGTFDPVHLGHLIIAESVLNELNLDKVVFIPAHKHALKTNEKISPPDVRLKMLQIAVAQYSYFNISDIELQSSNTSFTIDTLKNIKSYEKFGEAEIFYIIGYDNLPELHLWKDHKEILDLVQVAVVGRTGNFNDTLINEFKEKVQFLNTPQIDISSTIIRERIKNKKAWKTLVSPEVYQFIQQNNLYK